MDNINDKEGCFPEKADLAPRPFWLDEDGSVFIEYILLVGMFGLIIAGAVISLGEPMLNFYRHSQSVWGGSFP